MSIIAYIIIFTLIGSIGSLIGGVILLFREKLALRLAPYLTAFAAGALLAASFFELIPEAVEHAEEMSLSHSTMFIFVLIGILIFYLLERFIHLFHHSHLHESHHEHEEKHTIPLLVIGDSFHNFIDGVLIAATFLVSVPLGIVTTLAVAAHEIPQEIGDFGILLKRGMSKKKIILINILSGLLALLGALIGYLVGETVENIIPFALAITSGFFIYISLSDLIPDIHHENKHGFALKETIFLLLGVVVLYLLITLTHQGH